MKAIEPTFVNLTALAENVRLNELSSSVLILPLALSDFDSPAMLSVDNIEIGHSNNQISNGTNQTELLTVFWLLQLIHLSKTQKSRLQHT